MPDPLADPPPPARRRSPRLALGISTGATAVAAGTLLVVSRGAAGRFGDPAITDEDELRSARGTANSTLAGSAGLGLATVGLGVAFVVVRRCWHRGSRSTATRSWAAWAKAAWPLSTRSVTSSSARCGP